MRRGFGAPTGFTSPASSARSSLTWSGVGRSPISSRNSVPPSAAVNAELRGTHAVPGAGIDLRLRDASAVEVGDVGGGEILEDPAAAVGHQPAVEPRDVAVFEDDLIRRIRADRYRALQPDAATRKVQRERGRRQCVARGI